tara:strand:- start:6743 stop:7330 length:588 start_codon:yes stop_codon:yes gene_type:complete
MPKKRNIHYVNNADFSHAVVEYVKVAESAKKSNKEVPKVTDYIATCFLKIAEGLSHKANFIRYTYREEMVMDAVENCLKAINNYNLEAATRTGKPNAFAYFTQITWFAFLRRIAKEKKQQEIKLKYLTQSGIENFISENENADESSTQVANSFVDSLRNRIEKVKTKDEKIKTITKQIKRRRKIQVDSDLQEFML